MITLGIDTSNYATSLALYDSAENRVIAAIKKFLTVKQGQLGLRQSDAVFEHTKAMPELLRELATHKSFFDVEVVGVSSKPRNIEGSYMPCFLAGKSVASAITLQTANPLVETSHQEGHIAAALFGTNRLDLWNKKFYAFHVSGGTTDLMLVNGMYDVKQIGTSTDLYAGQAIDRLGNVLGFPFPSGEYVSQLAEACKDDLSIQTKKPSLHISISGVENQYKKLLDEKYTNEQICKFTLTRIAHMLNGMLVCAKEQYGDFPVIAAGGVMSSTTITHYLKEKQTNIYFAPAQFSSDNAVGVAIIASKEI